MNRRVALIATLLACSDPAPQGVVEPSGANEGTADPQPTGAYSVHEWGLIAHHHADADGAMLGAVPAPWRAHHVPDLAGRAGGKPILYVHLADGVDQMEFEASVRLPSGGAIVEHWPDGETAPGRVSWSVQARTGACPGQDYPDFRSERCQSTEDRYCEVAELPNYVTEDSACLSVDGRDWNHLFYRARLPGALPLSVDEEGEGFVVRNDSGAALEGRLVRIHRAQRAEETRVEVFDAPAPGASQPVPASPSGPASEGRELLSSELRRLGLTAAEIEAFMEAWEVDLLGSSSRRSAHTIGTQPAALRPKEDALIYFLPSAAMDVLAPLHFDPEPSEVHRATLVRIDLGEEEGLVEPRPAESPGQGTIGLGNLGMIGNYGRGTSSSVAPARLRFQRLETEGALPREIVRRVVRARASRLRSCHERTAPDATLSTTLQLVIDQGGAVQSATTEQEGDLASCITSVARRWRFPSMGSGVTRATIPMSFSTE